MGTVQIAKENQFAEIVEVANRIFRKGEDNSYFQKYHPTLYKDGVNTAELHYIVTEEDKIKALIGAFPSEMVVMGKTLSVCGVGTVCVDTDCRGKGYMKAMMNQLTEDNKDKCHISVLGGRRQRYEYFGYTPAALGTDFYFNRDNARHCFADLPTKYTFEVPSSDDVETFKKCLELYEKRQAYIKRTAEGFYDCLCNCLCSPLIIKKDGNFFGYMCISSDKREILEVETQDNADICYVARDYINAFDFGGITFSSVFHFETVKLDALTRICEGFHLCNVESYRIYDFKTVIKAFGDLKASYSAFCDGEFTVEIKDVQKLKIEVKNGKLSVTDHEGKADFTMSALEAVSVFFGQGAFNLEASRVLPAFAKTVFPLPLFFSVPDII